MTEPQPPGEPQPPVHPIPPEQRPGRNPLVVGLVSGGILYVVALLAGVLISTGGAKWADAWVGMFVVLLGLSPIALIVGIVLTVVRRTRLFGAGLLISVALGITIGGGVCVAVINSTA